jgi:IclR family KDG regulon transcriptional repressor
MKTNHKTSSYRIQVLDRAFEMLNVLAADGPELGVTDLASRLSLRRSTAHRLVMVLESSCFLQRDAITGKCSLGPRVMQLGLVALSRLDVAQVSKPHLMSLVDEVQETAHIGLLADSEVISIANVQCRQSLRFPSTVGKRCPFHCTSQGKAILAFSPPEQVSALLEQGELKSYTKNTITSKVRFLEELQLIRDVGYAIDDEEFEVGLRCIAAPVRDSSGQVMSALSVAGPAFRILDDRMAALSSAVIRVAARLSASLGFDEKRRRYCMP